MSVKKIQGRRLEISVRILAHLAALCSCMQFWKISDFQRKLYFLYNICPTTSFILPMQHRFKNIFFLSRAKFSFWFRKNVDILLYKTENTVYLSETYYIECYLVISPLYPAGGEFFLKPLKHLKIALRNIFGMLPGISLSRRRRI